MSARSTLVCGVAGSGSAPVLARAYSLAYERGLAVRAVHAVELPRSLFRSFEAEDLERSLAEARKRALEELATVMERSLPAADPRELDAHAALDRDLRVVAGPPWRALHAAAEEAGAHRLVVGAHEREGLTDLFGNTTRSVLAGAPCPVWVQKGPTSPVRRVVAGIDLSPEARATIALAREEAQAAGAVLELVHVFEEPQLGTAFGYPLPLPAPVARRARETAEREFQELIDAFDWPGEGELEYELSFVVGEPRHALTERAAGADLLVIGSHGHAGLTRGALGNVASYLVRHVQGPVLVLRLESEPER